MADFPAVGHFIIHCRMINVFAGKLTSACGTRSKMGIDEAEHAETAYDFASVGSGSALSMAGAGKEA